MDKIRLFRMTQIENIPHILRYGITHGQSAKANAQYVAIGDDSVISKRTTCILPNGRALSEYIPFYFGPRMPMLYVIQNGFNGVKRTFAENIVYCITSVVAIMDYKLDFVFTDGHAVDGLSSFYSISDIQNIENLIDNHAINRASWRDENDLDLKRRKEAEFLVAQDIPHEAILGFVVFNEKAKTKLMEYGILENKIAIRNTYFF